MYLIIYNKSIKENYKILIKIYKIYFYQVNIYKVAFTPYKYKLVYLLKSLKRFNIKVIIDFKVIIVYLKVLIRVLKLYINSKLRQGLYINKVRLKKEI